MPKVSSKQSELEVVEKKNPKRGEQKMRKTEERNQLIGRVGADCIILSWPPFWRFFAVFGALKNQCF